MSKEKIVAETLTRLDSREAFAKWLWTALSSLYSKGDNQHLLIIIEEKDFDSVTGALAYLYERYVLGTKQLMFRQAIGDVLREHGNDKDAPLDALRDLIYLISMIEAAESLDSLLPTVGNGFLGKRHPDILYDIFANLLTFAPSPQIYELILNLMNSENFDDGYLFTAIKILVSCEPSHASDIVDTLSPRLSKLKQGVVNLNDEKEWSAFCEAAKDCAQHIAALGNNVVADKIYNLTLK